MTLPMASTMKWKEENLETRCLVWLQPVAFIHPDLEQQLRSFINRILIFDNVEKCKTFIQSSTDERIVLIANEELGRQIIPQIHNLVQQKSIYIYGTDDKDNNWIRQYPKVKCCLNQFDKMISLMKLAERKDRLIGEESLSITICNIQPEGGTGERSSTDLTGAFIHSHLFIETLTEMHTRPDSFSGRNETLDDFIRMCSLQYDGNQSQLILIDNFRRSYKPDKAIWWYTRDTFVYRLLNKALRIENIEILLLFQFFIQDIRKQLIDLNETIEINESAIFYRGQLMSREEIDALRCSVGNIISIKSFLSTTLNKTYAMILLDGPTSSNDYNVERVLFEISFNSRVMLPLFDISFASISKISQFPKEEEVLFFIGSIFRITDIRKERTGLWKICMVYLQPSESPLYRRDGNYLNGIYQYIKGHELIEGSHQMGLVLRLAGKLSEAERYYRQKIEYYSRIDSQTIERQIEDNQLLNDLFKFFNTKPRKHDYTKDIEDQLDFCRFQLALITRDKGDYDACRFWSEYLQKYDPQIRPHQLYLCYYYLLTGEIYEHSGQLAKALNKYEKAWSKLMVFSKGKGDGNISTEIIINIANISVKMPRKRHEPLKLYEKALDIYTHMLPSCHPKIGEVRLKIGDYYRYLSQYKSALEEYEDCLQIFIRSLPPDHVNIGLTYYAIGICYQLINHQNDKAQAISYLEKAQTIFRKQFLSDHWSLMRTEQVLRQLRNKFKVPC